MVVWWLDVTCVVNYIIDLIVIYAYAYCDRELRVCEYFSLGVALI
jgi:hypothetical protein